MLIWYKILFINEELNQRSKYFKKLVFYILYFEKSDLEFRGSMDRGGGIRAIVAAAMAMMGKVQTRRKRRGTNNIRKIRGGKIDL